jgi:hypothetical protein
MIIRVRIARSVTRNLRALCIDTVQGATLTGYGFLVAMAWLLFAGRLH